MKLIDKDALVAEIERLKDELKASDSATYAEAYIIGAEHTIKTISDVIDTLEVKEVDLDSNIRTYLTNHFNIYEDGVLQSKKSGLPLSTYDIIKVANHFFELGMQISNKAQKGE